MRGTNSSREDKLAAEHFERMALMEHASIAAFARFTLQLLSLGAPFALIAESNRAQRDETNHARLAFTLATRFSGSPCGPGPLDVRDALVEMSPAAILATTIVEGCVGETVAALEASAALEQCCDEEVRRVLGQVVEDETRHAQLAWRTVQWMLMLQDAAWRKGQ